ncbi:hypothetical protein BA953_08775 [Vibrio coralliilyticus]|uniref:type II toxin-antitoxin system YafO family toxin n=1 Tax=Vibrio coralliilyticus TaxID=190893 RepID=UPI0008109EC4|nr:type II toxin-antitoxin system YafO family toxin [Vibrio coralliilyticus]ANW24304.1 hypothetical protein BA953_08775 [Vibrio coralliilyticus]
MIKKKVKPTERFKQEMQAQGFQDINALCKDIAYHLTYENLEVKYLGRIGQLFDPSWASDVQLGHVHLWDTGNPTFKAADQKKWKNATDAYSRTSNTCIVYSAHWERESEILLMGVATPCHGSASKLYDRNFMDYFKIEGEKFQDT